MTADLRRDFADIRKYRRDSRSPERLRAHYLLECALANRLKSAAQDDRAKVYGRVYDELFDALTDHPQHAKRAEPTGRILEQHIRYIAPFLKKDGSFVEIGCGDAALSFAVAKLVRSAVGVDVQEKLVDLNLAPPNFRFVKLDEGTKLPFESKSVDVVLSDQLLEHLHPEDVVAQLVEVARILKTGGVYVCTTPNAITGPHDITMYFGHTAAGLHLKEYTYREFKELFRTVGFKKISVAIHIYGRQITMPIDVGIAAEWLFSCFPRSMRDRMSRTRIVERLMGISAIART